VQLLPPPPGPLAKAPEDERMVARALAATRTRKALRRAPGMDKVAMASSLSGSPDPLRMLGAVGVHSVLSRSTSTAGAVSLESGSRKTGKWPN
jgi:hypothetical protein